MFNCLTTSLLQLACLAHWYPVLQMFLLGGSSLETEASPAGFFLPLAEYPCRAVGNNWKQDPPVDCKLRQCRWQQEMGNGHSRWQKLTSAGFVLKWSMAAGLSMRLWRGLWGCSEGLERARAGFFWKADPLAVSKHCGLLLVSARASALLGHIRQWATQRWRLHNYFKALPSASWKDKLILLGKQKSELRFWQRLVTNYSAYAAGRNCGMVLVLD